LRGRGGAGFPTGKKWSFVPRGAPGPRYLVCNADEMEPGSFKDRVLMERAPHLLLEGMVLAAFAIGAGEAILFLRQGYAAAQEALERAIAAAYGRGALGPDVLGTGVRVDLRLHVSAGRYICGEETALLNALEGRRPVPREKPPHPQVSGLWGRPTVVNNVETLCNVPGIVRNGPEWYRALGRGAEGGTKIYAVSGRVRRPGAWELPMGTPLRELLEERAGGMREGFALRAVLPGGASTEFLPAEHLDVALDFDSVQKAGSRLGTGTVVVLDDRTCPVGTLLSLERFFARESCGWCTPCREGLAWVERILAALERGDGTMEDLAVLEEHTRLLGPGRTFCAHAPGAMEPLRSALALFRGDFERHVREGGCPWKR
ncbi:MAG TPA: NADH-ubiquinone oxidoreductase-F iron-sulfur binding region domain-containing protein, partial [bacterium]